MLDSNVPAESGLYSEEDVGVNGGSCNSLDATGTVTTHLPFNIPAF